MFRRSGPCSSIARLEQLRRAGPLLGRCMGSKRTLVVGPERPGKSDVNLDRKAVKGRRCGNVLAIASGGRKSKTTCPGRIARRGDLYRRGKYNLALTGSQRELRDVGENLRAYVIRT